MTPQSPADMYAFSVPFVAPKGSAIRELFRYLSQPGMISLAGGYPSKDLFDRDGIAEAMRRAYEEDPVACLQYGDTQGAAGLRTALTRLMLERGVACDAEDIVVTTGSQQGFDLLIRMLIQPGDLAIVEEPAYPAAIQALRLAGAEILSVPVTADGIDVVQLEALLTSLQSNPLRKRPKLLYTVPTFANPSGALLTLERREALLRLAVEHRLLIVEDDPYGELRFDGAPLPTLLALAKTIDGAADRLVYLGSLSKIVAPGLRIGWMIGPEAIRQRAIIAKQVGDLCTAPLLQEVATHYLDDGALTRHLPRIVAAYKGRRDALINALRRFLPEDMQFTAPQGGMFVWAKFTAGTDASVVLKRCIERNVMYVPGSAFYVTAPDVATLRLSFAASEEAALFEGVKRLTSALRA